MKMPKINKENDVILPVRMKEDFKKLFKNHCDKNGYSMNKRLKILIEKDLNGEIK